MSLLPVKAAPAVPAPPPARAPIAAPFPPPARPPISAPSPAPPPAITRLRLPLPVMLRATAAVWIFMSLPFTFTELRRTWRRAPPLNRPRGCAATTVPCAVEPEGITTLPFTCTGCATVAENPCPSWLLFELSVSPRRTVITVPAGTVRAALDGLAGCAALLFLVVALVPAWPEAGWLAGEDELLLAAGWAAGVSWFELLPHPNENRIRKTGIVDLYNAYRDRICASWFDCKHSKQFES